MPNTVDNLPTPENRVDLYLNYLATGTMTVDQLPEPISNIDKFLYFICVNGGIGTGTSTVVTGGTWFTGTLNPPMPNNTPAAKVGDYYLNTTTKKYYYYKDSTTWQEMGILEGSNATNGTKWWNGNSTNRTPQVGNNGDYFLDNETGQYYEKVSGQWQLKGTLKGATGAAGTSGAVGARGPVGPTGPTGAKGEDGATWYTGAGNPNNNGPIGKLNDLYLDTQTGDIYKFTNATWGQSILNIKGAKGDRGETGPAGPAGTIGPQGPPGPTGPQGIQGNPGPAGNQGATGPRGETGPAGPAGERGPAGEQGPAGPPGPTGQAGPAGERGEQGPPGPTGPAAEWNYGSGSPIGVIDNQGKVGDLFIDRNTGNVYKKGQSAWEDIRVNIKGPAGDKGETGPTGPPGPAGEQGPPGPTGPAGPSGAAATPSEYLPKLSDFRGGWSQLQNEYHSGLTVYKVNGVVYLQGAIGRTDGVTPQPGAEMFVLPAGYYPSKTILFPVVTNNLSNSYTIGMVSISTGGLIKYYGGHTGIFDLSGISFVAG